MSCYCRPRSTHSPPRSPSLSLSSLSPQVMARKHYSVDVVVGLWTVPLLWQVGAFKYPDPIPHASVEDESLVQGTPMTERASMGDASV